MWFFLDKIFPSRERFWWTLRQEVGVLESSVEVLTRGGFSVTSQKQREKGLCVLLCHTGGMSAPGVSACDSVCGAFSANDVRAIGRAIQQTPYRREE